MEHLNVYASGSAFEQEKQQIYRKYWLYFCQKSFLNKLGDTYSRDICGAPVSVRLTANGLIAFLNVCAHRKATIFTEELQNRPFVCKYHGWSYDDNAELAKIANSQDYKFSDSQVKKCGGLIKFSVCELGGFVFVSLADDPIDINDQFDAEFMSSMIEASLAMDKSVIKTDWLADYNWKLNFENVMDYNHVRFVHPLSFNASLKPVFKQTNDEQMAWKDNSQPYTVDSSSVDVKDLSYSGKVMMDSSVDVKDLSYSGKVMMDWPEKWWRECTERYGDGDYFRTWYIFPNVNFVSLGDDQFYIQQYDPVSPKVTSVRLELMTSKRTKKVNLNPLLAAMIDADKRIIDEDIPIIESQQKNLSKISYGSSYFQGDLERRLLNFRGWLDRNVYS